MNMSKRLYVSPKLAVVEFESPKLLCASLKLNNDTIDTSGRANKYNEPEPNNGNPWDHEWQGAIKKV